MFHIDLGGCIVLLLLLICRGGPESVARFAADLSCLFVITGARSKEAFNDFTGADCGVTQAERSFTAGQSNPNPRA